MDQDVVPVVAAQLRQREAGDAEDDVQLSNRNVLSFKMSLIPRIIQIKEPVGGRILVRN